jgi:c-di-AMP phosphodiesterase-like protein
MAGHLQRQAGEEGHDAGDVAALFALGVGTAEDQVLDVRRVHARALDQALHGGGGQVVGTHAGESAFLREVEGGAGVARDHGRGHGRLRVGFT